MKQRFRLYRRKSGGRYYAQDNLTGQQASLRTTNHAEAVRLVHAKNEAEQQPALSVQIARAYLVAADPMIATRTWQAAMNALVASKQGSNRQR